MTIIYKYKNMSYIKYILILISSLLLVSCNADESKPKTIKKPALIQTGTILKTNTDIQVHTGTIHAISGSVINSVQ